MPGPLAILRRGDALIAFHRWPPRTFRHAGEAELYLRHWARDDAAMGQLRDVLGAAFPGMPLFAVTDEQVLQTLAACLADGSIVLMPAGVREIAGPGDADKAFGQPQAAPPPAPVAASVLPILTAAAPPNPAAALLENLEEVSIEGAEVKPEIEESLAAVDVSLGNVSLAGVSLEPTPNKVDPIASNMSEVSAGAVQTIDGL